MPNPKVFAAALSLSEALPLLVPSTASASKVADFRSPAAAAQVIRDYYAAIDRGNFRAAYAAWARGGRASGKSYANFRAGFASTASSRVVPGAPTNGDGAAGSIFVDIPVDVIATLKNGRRQHFRGRYTLRRVNDVDGATPAQLHWHIESAKLLVAR